MLTHTALYLLLPGLFFIGLLAGMVDAIAGGGGLITLPFLLFTGLSPQMALGTNKLQAMVGTAMATAKYYQHGWFSFRAITKGLIFGVAGAVLGASSSQLLNSAILGKLLPILLFLILLYMLLTPALGREARKPMLTEFWFYIIFGFTLGFYDGFFGPATGSLWVFSLTFFLGYHFRQATAYAKVFNLKSNIVAAICFALGGNIDYRIALFMGAGQLIGGRLGAHFAILKGNALIRPVFILVTTATILSLLYKSYF
jgi:uncharacterized membrane protein YfcA